MHLCDSPPTTVKRHLSSMKSVSSQRSEGGDTHPKWPNSGRDCCVWSQVASMLEHSAASLPYTLLRCSYTSRSGGLPDLVPIQACVDRECLTMKISQSLSACSAWVALPSLDRGLRITTTLMPDRSRTPLSMTVHDLRACIFSGTYTFCTLYPHYPHTVLK